MCKIRIIFKTDNDRIVKDEVFPFENLEISPIDRPAYVTCLIEDEKVKIYSYFINDSEAFCEFTFNEKLCFKYGELSGRIESLITSYTMIYETTSFSIMQMLPGNPGIRVSNNVREYLKLYNHVLKILESSLKYKNEECAQEVELIEQ